MMVNDILESLKADMVEQEKLFNGVRQQIVDLANEYNKKLKEYSQQVTDLNNTILELEAEGNKEIKKLQEQQEYYRGAYTCLYNQYVKFGGDVNKTETVSIKNESEVEPKAKETKSATKKSTAKKSTVKKSELSEDELKKIQTITTAVNKSIKEEDIPDYLKDEYNK